MTPYEKLTTPCFEAIFISEIFLTFIHFFYKKKSMPWVSLARHLYTSTKHWKTMVPFKTFTRMRIEYIRPIRLHRHQIEEDTKKCGRSCYRTSFRYCLYAKLQSVRETFVQYLTLYSRFLNYTSGFVVIAMVESYVNWDKPLARCTSSQTARFSIVVIAIYRFAGCRTVNEFKTLHEFL